jgi:hypothetical protein
MTSARTDRGALTKHAGEMSWTVTRTFEEVSQKVFGEDGPMTRDTYRVTLSREDPWWVAVVDDVGATEAKKVAELEDMVRDLIMVMGDLDTPDFDLVWDYNFPAKAAEALKDFLRSRESTRSRNAVTWRTPNEPPRHWTRPTYRRA